MIMMFRKIAFQSFIFAIVGFSALMGAAGGEAIAIDIFGTNYFQGPLPRMSIGLWIMILFLGFGGAVSGIGAWFLLAVPIATIYPEECRTFNFMRKSSKAAARVFRWYSRAFERQALEMEED